MTLDKIHEQVIMDRFAGWIVAYVEDYFSEGSILSGHIKIDYELPDVLYVKSHWMEMKDELLMLNPVYTYSAELKLIAVQCLPAFIKEYPQYKDEGCLNLHRVADK